MAVFLLNICKFNGCGITFPSLGDLIQHIEDTHIDYDPKVIEQKEQTQPACLPLSYVLRFITDTAKKDTNNFISTNGVDLKRKLAIKHHSYSLSSSSSSMNRSNTPTGSEMDEDEFVISESEDSNESWTTEEFSSEFIMRYGSRHSGSNSGSGGNEKPFACPVPGCKKRYKNVNGIKYHSKNGHKKDGKVRKGYKCHCGKSYKTAQGLKSHVLVAHNNFSSESINNNTSMISGGSVSPSQSVGSLSPSSISNLSGSSNGCGNMNGSSIICNQSMFSPLSSQQQQQQQQQQQPQHLRPLSPNIININSNMMSNSSNSNDDNNIGKTNIGSMSIKTVKTNLISTASATITSNKIISKISSPGGNSLDSNNKMKFDTTPTARLSLPELLNLGVIAPTNSAAKFQAHSFQQQNLTAAAANLTNNTTNGSTINISSNIGGNIINNNSSENICSNTNSSSNSNQQQFSNESINLHLTSINANLNSNSNNNLRRSITADNVATTVVGTAATISFHSSGTINDKIMTTEET